MQLAQTQIRNWASNGRTVFRMMSGLSRSFHFPAATFRLIALTACYFLLSGPAAAAAVIEAAMGTDQARHLLARTGFGPTASEVREFSALSRTQAVERLLSGAAGSAATPQPSWVSEAIVPPRAFRDAPAEERQAYQRKLIRQAFELRAWWIDEMLATDSPLRERMTLFWHNHFTSSQQKVRYPQLMYRQNTLLRQQALGNFGGLLHAVSKDPAMIIYLDSASNRKGKPNENFAREVMELFTLGEGHYGENDIREAARAFTGWSIDIDSGAFVYRPVIHDGGEKTVLGRSGAFNGDDVLDVLLAQPRTAEYVVEKLWREFISPEPDAREVQRIAAAFRASGYDIATALRALLLSPAFWDEDNRAVLVKSPAEYVVGTLRQLDVPVGNAAPLAVVMAGLGQNLFAPPNVKGWPGGDAWINSATLLARKQFVERLFRTEEMAQAPAQTVQLGQRPPPQVLLARAVNTLPAFSSRSWFKSFGSDTDPAIAQLLLAAEPANPMPAELAGRERLRQLALDPAFQLK